LLHKLAISGLHFEHEPANHFLKGNMRTSSVGHGCQMVMDCDGLSGSHGCQMVMDWLPDSTSPSAPMAALWHSAMAARQSITIWHPWLRCGTVPLMCPYGAHQSQAVHRPRGALGHKALLSVLKEDAGLALNFDKTKILVKGISADDAHAAAQRIFSLPIPPSRTSVPCSLPRPL
jgi:hypothetical protein